MDVIGALVSIVSSDAGVTAALGTGDVYGDELPDGVTSGSPSPNVVIRIAGGGSVGGPDKQWGDVAVAVDTYDVTTKKAHDLYDLVRTALAAVNRETVTVDGTPVLIHDADETVRGITGRDPDTKWPTCVGLWQVLTAEA
jgi:hypothetical protein